MNNPSRRVQDITSEAEWNTCINLAASYRLIAHFGMLDLIYNHITARVPGSHKEFLINPYGMMYEEITASSLVKVDLEGNVLFNVDDNFSANRAGHVIHSAIHAARHDVESCHSHAHTRRHDSFGAGVRPPAAHTDGYALRCRRLS